MLMPRVHYPNAFNSELSFALSMQHQQNHINQLLNTAAAATGIVGDVDALLAPISMPPQNNTPSTPMAPHIRERNLWRINEVKEMLNIMVEIDAMELLNDKAMKSEFVFRKIEKLMNERGYCKKSHVQIWTKWKFLKTTYTTSKRNGSIPKVIPYEIYQVLEKMLHMSHINMMRRRLSDQSSSVNSQNGDMSNGADNSSSKQLVISGVEGGYNTSNADNCSEEGDENSFGMAHPIFGFRLGLVKQEPADTGYETVDASPKDVINKQVVNRNTTANIQFQTDVKQELEDEDLPLTLASTSMSPPPIAPSVSPEQAPETSNTNNTLALNNQPVRILTAPPVPNATSTSTAPADTEVRPPVTENLPMPPLRIAPFAKVSNPNAFSPTIGRPLPPLSMQARFDRLNHSTNGLGSGLGMRNNSAEPMGLRKPMEMMIPPRYTHAQSAGHRNLQRSNPRPFRQSSYPLHPECVLPDMDSSTPPPAFMKHPHFMYHNQPSTSQQMYKPNMTESVPFSQMKKKRRLNVPHITAEPVKLPTIHNYANSQRPRFNDFGGDTSRSSSDEPVYPRTFHGDKQTSTNKIKNNDNMKSIEASMIELSKSLREMQQESMKEFFQQQMELARQEHEFQMQQDFLIMHAFTQQSQSLMKSVQKLLDETTKKAGPVQKSVHNKNLKKQMKRHKMSKIYQSKRSSEAPSLHETLNEMQASQDAQAPMQADAAAEEETDKESEDDSTNDSNKEHVVDNEKNNDNGDVNDDEDDEDDEEENEYEQEQTECETNEYLQDNSADMEQEDSEDEDEDDDDDDDEDEEEEDEENIHKEDGDKNMAHEISN